MFGRTFNIFKLFGFQVKVDVSWIFIAVLITWSLASGLFPRITPGLETSTYWLMGVGGALGLFLSIVIHEFCHSIVARHYGLPMKGITLFIFGGVAEMEDEPATPKTEFLMAVAGPAASVVLGIVLLALSAASTRPTLFGEVLRYLGGLNLLLAAFNLVPAFPLDGGRVLRSALWAAKKNLWWATRVASSIGSGFGLVMMILGFASILFGGFIMGMWWILIGWFVKQAASMSYQRLVVRRTLEGVPVSRFMKRDPVTVPPSLSLDRFVEDYVYQHHYKMFPVVSNGRLDGCITTRHLKEVPREQWPSKSVGEISTPCSPENSIEVDADAMAALSTMRKHGTGRLMVLENGQLAGVLTLKDLMDFLALKLDLEKEGPGLARPA